MFAKIIILEIFALDTKNIQKKVGLCNEIT